MTGIGPIFVVGAARSGTSLVASILGQHSAVYAPGESHFMEEVWARRRQFGPLQSAKQVDQAAGRLLTAYGRHSFDASQRFVDQTVDRACLVRQVMAAGGGYGALYRAFSQQLAAGQGKQTMCDDTPKHVFHLAAIASLFPDARIIACVRDPRDYLASYKNYWRRSLDPGRIRRLYHPILSGLLWRGAGNALQVALDHGEDAQLMLLRYERLVEDAAHEVPRLAAFLGLPFEPSMLEPPFDNSSFGQQQPGIHTASVGRWPAELEEHEVWWLSRIAGVVAARFGYDVQPAPASWWRVAWTLLSLPLAGAGAFWANRGRRGPSGAYIRHRLRAIFRQ